jgi:endonuclease/exonuclease/phosphatase (EEP) superfamily protein YafD
MKTFHKVLFIICTALSILGIVFYNNLYLGTFHILSRYLTLVILGFLLWRNWEFKHYIFLPILLLSAEIIVSKIRSIHLNTYTPKIQKEFCIVNHNLLFIENPTKKYIDSIKSINPDFLALQEFNPKWEVILNKKFKKSLKQNSCVPHKNDAYGFGFYSKHPIIHTEYLEEYKGIPYCQIVDVKINKDTVRIYNTHFDSPAIAFYGKGGFFELLNNNIIRRKLQYKSILDNANNCKISKKVFCGDLNTMRIEPLYRNFNFDWQNAKNKSLESKFTFKFQKHPPSLSIDHVFYKGNLKCNYSEVHRFGNSDHYPVISKFEY